MNMTKHVNPLQKIHVSQIHRIYEEKYSRTLALQVLIISISLSGPADRLYIQPCEKLRAGWSLFPRSRAK